MKTRYAVALSMLAGIVTGAVAIQGLHAQAKPKAYVISETEVLDASAQAAYTPLVRAALQAAGARPLSRPGGRIVATEGTAPKRVGINEWDSLEQAQAFYSSKAYMELKPQRDKAVKTLRRYIVETGN